jgi:hypothetical protein
MKFIILTAAILLGSLGFSQGQENKTIFKQLNTGEVHTIHVNSSYYSLNNIGKLKDELSTYHEKITDISFNEAQNLLSFTYNEFMQKEDLIHLFESNKIEYIKTTRAINLNKK